MHKKYKFTISLLTVFATAMFTVEILPKYLNQHKYTIGLINWPGFYPAVIAEQMGLYKKYGISVQLKVFEDNPELNSKLQASSVDMSYGVLADYVLMRGKGSSIKFIQVADYSRFDAIIGEKKIKSLKELKNKTIGIGDINSFSEFFIISLLNKANLNENDVRFKLVNYYDITDELEKKSIQAGHTWEPETSKALSKGYHYIAKAESLSGIITDGLAIHEEFLQNQTDIEKIILAFFDAQKMLIEKPEKFVQMLSEYFKEDPNTILTSIKEGVTYVDLNDNLKSFSNEFSDFRSTNYAVKQISEFYSNRGQIKSKFDMSILIDPRIIRNIKSQIKD